MNDFDSECPPDEDDQNEDEVSAMFQDNDGDSYLADCHDDLALLVQNLNDADIKKLFYQSSGNKIYILQLNPTKPFQDCIFSETFFVYQNC